MNLKTISLLAIFVSGLSLLAASIYPAIFQTLIKNVQTLYEDDSGTYTYEMNFTPHFVSEDFQKLYRSKKLPKAFFSLKNISVTYHDSNLKNLIPKSAFPFKTSKAGRYNLDVEAFSAPDEKTKVIVLQMNIVDTKSGNKIYELSRNYQVKN